MPLDGNYLARLPGSSDVEIECKSVTKVKGQWTKPNFLNPLCESLEGAYLATFTETGYIWSIRLRVTKTDHLEKHECDALSRGIRSAIADGSSQTVGGCEVIPTRLGSFEGDLRQVYSCAEEIEETEEFDQLVVFGGCLSPFVLVVTGLENDLEARARKVRNVWGRFLRAASKQLTGQLPGLLELQIERGRRVTGSTKRQAKARLERAAFASLIDSELHRIGRERPTLLGVNLSFAGPPFSEGATYFVGNPHCDIDHPILRPLPSLEPPPLIEDWFDKWDASWFRE